MRMASNVAYHPLIALGNSMKTHCLAIGMDICTHKFTGSELIASPCGGANQPSQSNCLFCIIGQCMLPCFCQLKNMHWNISIPNCLSKEKVYGLDFQFCKSLYY